MLQGQFIGDFKTLPSQGNKGGGKTPKASEGFSDFVGVAENIAQQAMSALAQVRTKIHASHPQSRQENSQNEITGRSYIFADPEGATTGRSSGSVVAQAEPSASDISGNFSFSGKTHDAGLGGNGIFADNAVFGAEQSLQNQAFDAKSDPLPNLLGGDLQKGASLSKEFATPAPAKNAAPTGLGNNAIFGDNAIFGAEAKESPFASQPASGAISDPLPNLLGGDLQKGASLSKEFSAPAPAKNAVPTGLGGNGVFADNAVFGAEAKESPFASQPASGAVSDPLANLLSGDLQKGTSVSKEFAASAAAKNAVPTGLGGNGVFADNAVFGTEQSSQNQTFGAKSDLLTNLLGGDLQNPAIVNGSKSEAASKPIVAIPEQLVLESAKATVTQAESQGKIEYLSSVMKKLTISDRAARGRFEMQNNILKGDGLDEAVSGRKKMWAPIVDKKALAPTLTKTPVQSSRFPSPSLLNIKQAASELLPSHVNQVAQPSDSSRKQGLESSGDRRKMTAKIPHRFMGNPQVNEKAAAYVQKESATVHFTEEEPAVMMKHADSAPKQTAAPIRTIVPLPDGSQKTTLTVSKTASPPGTQMALRVEQIQSIVNKTSGRFVQLAQSGGGRSVLVLKPAHLGRLRLEIDVKNSVAKALITAESQSVRAVLETEAPKLREALQQQGIRLDQFEVKEGWIEGGSHGANENAAGKNWNAPNRQGRAANKTTGEIDMNANPRSERHNLNGTISVTA
jgi:flagellar hook-length control protein FliK